MPRTQTSLPPAPVPASDGREVGFRSLLFFGTGVIVLVDPLSACEAPNTHQHSFAAGTLVRRKLDVASESCGLSRVPA